MNDESARPGPAAGPTHRGRRYRRHELALSDGGSLALRVDGTIELRDADGAVTQAWAPDDEGWADQAIRFGLRPETRTVRPDGHRGKGPNPPAN